MLASEDAGDDDRSFARARRLRMPAEFAAILQAPRPKSIRAARQLLAISAVWTEADTSEIPAGVRFGVIVGKRNARRAVDRTLVKRIVREACRRQASALERWSALAAVRVDIALRLKAPLVDKDGQPLAMRQWRRQLRLEADALLEHVLTELTGLTLIEAR